jgi:hypothetical protein
MTTASFQGAQCTLTTTPTQNCINVIQASPGGTVSVATNLNQIAIIESLTASSNFVDGLAFTHQITGGNGGRQSIQLQTTVNGWAATGGNAFVAAFVPSVVASATTGGLGLLFSINPAAYNLVGSQLELAAQENDVYMAAGTSSTYLSGLKIVQLQNHAVHGGTQEAGLVFSNQASTVGWNVLIGFGTFSGGVNPLSTTGTIMSALSAISTSGHGIDFTNVTFTGSGCAFKSPGFCVNGSAQMVAAALVNQGSGVTLGNGADLITVAGTAGITVSSTTQSTAVNNGAINTAGGLGVAKNLNVGGGAIFAGVKPTLTGTCAVVAGTQVGGAIAGSFAVPAGNCATTTTVIASMPTAPNGWACDAHDLTTPTSIWDQTASAAGSVTYTIRSVNAAAADVIEFKCMGF